MTNPYYWDFPKRADTMYMSTIGILKFIKKIKIALTQNIFENQHFQQKILKEPTVNNKYQLMFIDRITITHHGLSLDLSTLDQLKSFLTH